LKAFFGGGRPFLFYLLADGAVFGQKNAGWLRCGFWFVELKPARRPEPALSEAERVVGSDRRTLLVWLFRPAIVWASKGWADGGTSFGFCRSNRVVEVFSRVWRAGWLG